MPNQTDTPDRILRLKTVLTRTGLSRSTMYRKVQNGSFPQERADQHPLHRLARIRHQRLDTQSDVLHRRRPLVGWQLSALFR
jgi:hypothetical protein